MYTKFDIKKHKRELKKIAKENGINSEASINVILNNMQLYNELIDDITDSTRYLIYQMSSTIFKQLQDFQLTPTKKKSNEDDGDDKLLTIKKKVNNVK